MKKPMPIPTQKLDDGRVVQAKCAACDEYLDLGSSFGSVEDQNQKLATAFGRHLRERHPEDFSQAAARIVREATENR